MKTDIVVIGGGGHAKVVMDIIEQASTYRIVGLIDSFKPVGSECFDYHVIGTEQQIAKVAPGITHGIVTIGDNWTREQMVKKVLATTPGFQFITAIHPSACLGRGVSIGEGTVIMAGAIINPCSRIGKHCIVNTAASLDHDNVLEDFAHVAPGACVGGNVKVGRGSAIMMGATVIHGITIGDNSVVGAGSTVLNDIEPNAVAYGIPADIVRKRQANDRYL